jgi:hypothetical protein
LNVFESALTPIPPGFKRVKANKAWVKDFICDMSKIQLHKPKFSEPKKRNVFFVHDNGGRPFMVRVGNKNERVMANHKYKVEIWKESPRFFIDEADLGHDYENAWVYTELVTTYKALRVFIGKDRRHFLSTQNLSHKGNSILLQVGKHRYVYIGDEIYEFDTADNILSYVSPVGNSDVPYPFAVGEENVYFMLDKVSVPIKAFPPLERKEDVYNLYRPFYDFNLKGTPMRNLAVIADRQE